MRLIVLFAVLLALVVAAVLSAIALAIAAAVVGAAIAIAAAVVGALGPVLLMLGGVWLLWRGSRPSRRERRAARLAAGRRSWRAPLAAARPEGTRLAAVAQSEPSPPPRPDPAALPVDVQMKVDQIERKVAILLGQADRFPPFSLDLHLVRQTAGDYLPRTLAAYRSLRTPDAGDRVPGSGFHVPRSWGRESSGSGEVGWGEDGPDAVRRGAADPAVTPSGKTARQELLEQLDLLDAKIEEIERRIGSEGVDRLLANRRFLEERLQSSV